MNEKLFQRNFTMVVIGQIISLFGNNILRYALPLYLLNQTGSAALFGLVAALSFLPMVILAPVGGIIADRVNKRNVMVCLDFCTAGLMLFYAIMSSRLSLVPLLVVVLMVLYGIQGAYQPTVQAALPALVSEENLMAGNAIINAVNSLAGVLGPVLGGLIFGFWGLGPIVFISILCFTVSAVMEIFIHIPFEKRVTEESIAAIVVSDMKDSAAFIRSGHPEVGKAGLLLMAVNLFFSALIVIGLPVVINTQLGFSESFGNRLYGYAQGMLAAGGLIGAFLSGIIGKKIDIRNSAYLIFFCTLSLLPMGIILMVPAGGMMRFAVIAASCMALMILSTVFSIQMITYMQKITPQTLIGKVMALVTCIVMCGHPVGQALYGMLFEHFSDRVYVIFYGAFIVCIVICWCSNRLFRKLDGAGTAQADGVITDI